jgi:hypothetical protein
VAVAVGLDEGAEASHFLELGGAQCGWRELVLGGSETPGWDEMSLQVQHQSRVGNVHKRIATGQVGGVANLKNVGVVGNRGGKPVDIQRPVAGAVIGPRMLCRKILHCCIGRSR